MKVKLIGAKIGGYKTKGLGMFSFKQLCFILAGFICGITVYRLIMNILPIMIATFASAAVGISIIACGFLTLGSLGLAEALFRVLKLAAGKGKIKFKTEDSEHV
ncbi:MAG: PrgI family protein [Clostridia bacterium]|nr:PrgI family protein [Clostridia bacterium]